MTYAFRLRVNLPSAHVLISSEGELPIVGIPFAPSLTLAAVGTESISEANRLAFRTGGYASADDARSAADALREVLTVAFASHGVGVNFGKNEQTTRFSETVRLNFERGAEEFTGERTQVLSDVHGIVVFEDLLRTVFLGVSGTGVVGRQASAILETAVQVASDSLIVSPALRLALELCNSAPFESTPRARFLSLITCIEVLAERQARQLESLEVLEQLLAMINRTALADGERKALAAGVIGLQTESIGSACYRLVESHGNDDDPGVWLRAHKLRHRLVHGGITSGEVQEILPQLEQLVKGVVVASVAAAKVAPGANKATS